jgi:mannobiose 2-epimerase
MPSHPGLDALRAGMARELTERLLPWWMSRAPDPERGGFVGRITGAGEAQPDAPRGSILNARILWAFSAAYRMFGREGYREMADRAFNWFDRHFVDPDWGGVYWMVGRDGRPTDDRKHAYAQSFAIYALAEYCRATGDERALRRAVEVFTLLEDHARDRRHGGYLEAFSRAWERLEDQRLSEKDADVPKTMNTHLHLLEAFTGLYGVWPDGWAGARLRELVDVFLDRVVDPGTGHVLLYFDEDWTPRSRMRSYGHDIEASWLLLEAADALGDPVLRRRVLPVSLRLVDGVLREGVDADGGLFNERCEDGRIDHDKHWWPQAEAVVGFVNAWQETGQERYLAAAESAWAFTERFILDPVGGEWFWRVDRSGRVYEEEDRLGPWKCPYHNVRSCMEIMRRSELVPDDDAPRRATRA